ncbi:serine/threonine protein kinase, partial [Streptomyces sp. URMC 123]
PATPPPPARPRPYARLLARLGHRRARVSCTVVLTVTAALVGGYLLGVRPYLQDDDAGPAARPPSADTSATPRPGGVPREFLGSWEGAINASGLPAGTMKVTLTQGGVGARIGTAEQTDILGAFICEDLLTLTEASATELVVDTRRGPRSKSMCTEGSTGLRLTLENGKLRYASGDERAGRPTGTLSPLR